MIFFLRARGESDVVLEEDVYTSQRHIKSNISVCLCISSEVGVEYHSIEYYLDELQALCR